MSRYIDIDGERIEDRRRNSRMLDKRPWALRDYVMLVGVVISMLSLAGAAYSRKLADAEQRTVMTGQIEALQRYATEVDQRGITARRRMEEQFRRELDLRFAEQSRRLEAATRQLERVVDRLDRMSQDE